VQGEQTFPRFDPAARDSNPDSLKQKESEAATTAPDTTRMVLS